MSIDTSNQQSFSATFTAAMQNPWAYLGAAATSMGEAYKLLGKPIDDAMKLAADAEAGLLSRAAQQQRAAQVFSELAAGVSEHLTGLRGRLDGRSAQFADEALQNLSKASTLEQIVQTRTVSASALRTLGEAAGSIASALQLIQALQTDNLDEVGKAAFGVGAGVVAGLLGAAIGAGPITLVAGGLLVGSIADTIWDMGLGDIMAPNKNASFWDQFFDFYGFGNSSDTLITTLQTSFGNAQKASSPLILDLDGDGVETVSKTTGNHFDLDGNGFAEMTGWAGQDDGLLVLDRNGNGRIDDGAELFGNNTLLANGQKAVNGFEALKALDANRDGNVNAADAAHANLRVWKDANQNGITDAGELLTLEQAGVKSLATGYSNQSLTDAQGNQHLQTGRYTRTDGSTAKVDDVWFAVDNARTVDQTLVNIPADIAALPDLAGFGNVHSLRQAMARDGGGALKTLVQPRRVRRAHRLTCVGGRGVSHEFVTGRGVFPA